MEDSNNFFKYINDSTSYTVEDILTLCLKSSEVFNNVIASDIITEGIKKNFYDYIFNELINE